MICVLLIANDMLVRDRLWQMLERTATPLTTPQCC
jgi:hypothetical protein